MLAYIDETGDHSLIHIDPQYPIFGLGAILISEENYLKMNREVEKLKKEFFTDTSGDFILHSSELKRPLDSRSDPRNKVMLDPEVRKKFYREFDERIIKGVDFQIVACFIKKKTMAATYAYPADPYHFSFENLLNRIIRYGDGANVIYAEKRGMELNAELKAEYQRLSSVGIHSYVADIVSTRTSFKLVDKKENVAGLQVIDLILSCLARVGLGKREKMVSNDLDPDLLKHKYACPPTIFPRKKT